MPASTPIAQSKTAALSRVTDSAPKGYSRYVTGQVAADKAERVIRKLHERHHIGATPAQRQTRKKHGKANALLVVFWPEGAAVVEWLMLFTVGELDQAEQLREITENPRLVWLGYELVRRTAEKSNTPRWTWRRPKVEMTELHDLLVDASAKHQTKVVAAALARIANQPGFHGVREQSWRLCELAAKCGYKGELPHLFYLQKVSHGYPFRL